MTKDGKIVIYYWYDRGEIRDTPDEKIIMDAILNHDFDTFMKMYHKYPKDNVTGFVYFPDCATVFDEDDMLIGKIDITIPENFNKIDDTDYEWG